MDKKPYVKAWLTVPAPDSKDQRWVVKYKAWSELTGKLELCRDATTLNAFSDLEERKKQAKELIKNINKLLEAGKIIKATTNDIKIGKIYSVEEAVEMALGSRKSLKKKTKLNYENYAKNFLEWLGDRKKYNVQMISQDLLIEWVEDMKISEYAGKTINNHISHNSTLFNYLKEKKMILQNPFAGIKKVAEDSGKNVAYTVDQQKEILTFLEGKDNFIFLCKLMYYTLMRTNEISSIKVKDIGRYHPNKIYLSKEWSKNNTERQIDIHPELIPYIKQLKTFNKEWYIFSFGFYPGPDYYDSKHWGTYYRDHVLKKLNKVLEYEKYTLDYTLYSWKHSGVCSAYIAGASPGEIQIQAGFKDATSFNKYLKSLMLFHNTGFLSKIPTI